MTPREPRLLETLVELADTLVDEFDAVELLHTLVIRTVELLDVSAAGLMMSDQRGGLQVMASSSEEVRLLELVELQSDEGPCLECFRSGSPVAYDDLTSMRTAWPTFTAAVEKAGFQSAEAIPLRLRKETIGALNIFRATQGSMTADDRQVARAFADMATIGLLQERVIATRDVLAEQLQSALNSRVLLEQAKGVLAERTGLGMEQAFLAMRSHARSTGQRLGVVAEQIITGSLDVTALASRATPTSR